MKKYNLLYNKPAVCCTPEITNKTNEWIQKWDDLGYTMPQELVASYVRVLTKVALDENKEIKEKQN